MIYTAASIVCIAILPRLEHAYLASYTHGMSVSPALAFHAVVASGIVTLAAIVFSIVFVMVQFSAIAYSPRMALWFTRDRRLFHSLGVFFATFTFALGTLGWTDREGSGKVPLFSTMAILILLVISMLLFSLLVQRVSDLKITNLLRSIGDRGRKTIRTLFERLGTEGDAGTKVGSGSPSDAALGDPVQTLKYVGHPRSIASYDIDDLVRLARQSGTIIAPECAVGDTVVEAVALARVHGASTPLPEKQLMRAIHLARGRSFEQDPKYAIRLRVDIAIKALSPAINDPTTAVQAIDEIEDLLLAWSGANWTRAMRRIPRAFCASSFRRRPVRSIARSPSTRSASIARARFRSCAA